MNNHKTRLMAISGAALALVIASTASVAAAGPRDDERGMGFRGEQMHAGDWLGAGPMPGMRGGFRGAVPDFERQETTIQTADGVTAYRVEQGVVDEASDAALSFSLGSGESVTVTIDENTSIVAMEQQTVERGRWNRERMVPTAVAATDIQAGADVIVWSGSEDGSDFVAQRIVIEPAAVDDTTSASTDTTETPSAEPTDEAFSADA